MSIVAKIIFEALLLKIKLSLSELNKAEFMVFRKDIIKNHSHSYKLTAIVTS